MNSEPDSNPEDRIDWATVELPVPWPDQLDLARPTDLVRIIRHLFGPRKPVELPANTPGAEQIPAYLLREFHHLPNGNFSSFYAEGYLWAFDATMLGLSRRMRASIAERLKGHSAVLDLGCSGADLAAALRDAGVQDVVGLDASPYMLQQAARRHPGIPLVQGLAEKTVFPDGRFDAVAACFLFHELPSATQDEVLREARRILVPGGELLICEPSPDQMRLSLWQLLKKAGPLALWWKLIALLAHEPFVADWHSREPASWFRSQGFELVEDSTDIPFRTWVARRAA